MKKRAAYRSFLMLMASAVMLSVLILSGCNYERHVQNSTFDYGSKKKGDPKMLGSRMYGTMSGLPGQHDNAWFEYSSPLSHDVASINGVANALVMLTDKNAYVAITTDWTATGTRKSGGPKENEQNNGGTKEGVYNVDNGSPYWNNQRVATPYNSTLTINDHNQISGELKQTIAVHIRKLAPAVQEVHISASRDFNNYMVQYAQEAWAGRSLKPLTSSFNVLVKHEFAGGDVLPRPLDVHRDRVRMKQQ
ncbi:hypothetical protein [Paenibacillus montanisoli]|uniref:Sporulation protein n=1 Tax=Paenibacillus montanisoli TaxID=2081970 RepID=A0A328U0M8_9BACL|nr:hypothetical protein [Paenibacillus montanisoli]RAP75001.1 hypothetical protein DL346_16530 [Paenibacillus montanisoli]